MAAMLKLFGSVRFQVILFAILVVLAGNLTLNFFLTRNAEQMLISEKQEKLDNLAHSLVKNYDFYFDPVDGELRKQAQAQFKSYKGEEPKTEDDIFASLVAMRTKSFLTSIVENSTKLFGDEIGAGFYIQNQQRIYGFLEEPAMYPYRKLIATMPIGSDGSFVWVEESYRNINLKLDELQHRTNMITGLVIVLLLLFSFLFGFSFTNRIKGILRGLKSLETNLDSPLPAISGELGEISNGITQLAQSLVLSRTRSDLILNNAATAMISIDTQKHVLFFNQAAVDHLDIPSNEFTIDRIYSTLGPMIQNVVSRALKAGHSFSFDNYPVTLPTKQKFFHIVIKSHLDPTGEQNALITLDDVTENVKLIREAEKNESLRMLGMFTTGIAHEIRNPLTSVKGFVQLLGRKVASVSGTDRMVQLISREIERLEGLLKDLITYAKPSKTNCEWIQVSDIVSVIESLLKERIQQRKVQLHISSLERYEVFADQRKMHQVLFNLILNALQAVSIGEGVVQIYTEQHGESLKICVKDNGYGIEKEEFGKIFTPFFTTKDKGTGLGLAISRRMMEDMEGSITFDSVCGEQTVFCIEFTKWRQSASSLS